MSKHLIILCSVLILAGCAGNAANPTEVTDASGGTTNITDGSDWDNSSNHNDDTGIDVVDAGGGAADGVGRRTGGGDYRADEVAPIGIKSDLGDFAVGLMGKIDMLIRAKGGSGEYSWSHSGLPEGVDFADQLGNGIKIKGYVSKIGEFPVLIKVCDTVDTEMCDQKSFKLTVLDNRRNTSIASFTPTKNPCDNTDPLKITMTDTSISGGVAEEGLNRIELEKNIAMKFKVEGGRAPYTWSFISRTKKYWQAAHGIELPDTFAGIPNGDTYELSGAFVYSLPYCGESITDGSLLYMNRECKDDWSIRDRIEISVHDSCPVQKTGEVTYNFKLRSPDETARDLQMIDLRFSTDHTLSSSNMTVSLIAKVDRREDTFIDELEENDSINWAQNEAGDFFLLDGSDEIWLDQYEGEGMKTLRLPFGQYHDIAGATNGPLPEVVGTWTKIEEVSKDGMGADLEVTFQYFVIFSKYRFLIYEPQPMTTFTSNKTAAFYLLQKNVKRKELPNPFLHNNSVIFGPFEYVDPSGVPADVATTPEP